MPQKKKAIFKDLGFSVKAVKSTKASVPNCWSVFKFGLAYDFKIIERVICKCPALSRQRLIILAKDMLIDF